MCYQNLSIRDVEEIFQVQKEKVRLRRSIKKLSLEVSQKAFKKFSQTRRCSQVLGRIILLLTKVWSSRKIGMAIASSDIATTLLQGGKTPHVVFKLPLNLNRVEDPMCSISKQSITWHSHFKTACLLPGRNVSCPTKVGVGSLLHSTRFLLCQPLNAWSNSCGCQWYQTNTAKGALAPMKLMWALNAHRCGLKSKEFLSARDKMIWDLPITITDYDY